MTYKCPFCEKEWYICEDCGKVVEGRSIHGYLDTRRGWRERLVCYDCLVKHEGG